MLKNPTNPQHLIDANLKTKKLKNIKHHKDEWLLSQRDEESLKSRSSFL